MPVRVSLTVRIVGAPDIAVLVGRRRFASNERRHTRQEGLERQPHECCVALGRFRKRRLRAA
jgi:hypothetical protein